jgi:hypothetical protein
MCGDLVETLLLEKYSGIRISLNVKIFSRKFRNSTVNNYVGDYPSYEQVTCIWLSCKPSNVVL